MADVSNPLFFVRIYPQGSKTAVDQSERVTQLVYEDSESKADKLTLSILNLNLENFDDPIWAKGNLVEVQWGYPGRMSPAHSCVITKVTGAEMLSIEALGKEMLLHKIQRTRVFEQKKKSDIAQDIAVENGYGPSAQDIEDTEVVRPFTTQARQTDAQFMVKLAREEGFEWYIDFSGFHFHKRRVGQAPVRLFEWRSGDGEVIDFSIDNDITAKPGRVTIKGKDPQTGKPFTATGSNADTPRETMSSVIEIVDPETGATHIETTPDGSSSTQSSGSSATQASSAIASGGSIGEKEAKRKADGVFRKAQQTTVEMTWQCVGDPLVVAKTIGEFRGIGKRLSGKYWINSVSHTVGAGYTMELKVKGDGHAGYASAGGGQVTGEQKTKGTPNQKTPDDADAGGLMEIEVVDPETGATKLQWKDTKGRK